MLRVLLDMKPNYPFPCSESLIWWIDTFTVRPGWYYRYVINGYNSGTGSAIYWQIPALRGPYAFRLREVA